MLVIDKLSIKLADSERNILKNISLTINPGEIHLLNGKNGSGKSTLFNAVMGNPNFEIVEGSIDILNEEHPKFLIEKIDPEFVKNNNDNYSIKVSELEPDQKSYAGLYLASQYPLDIPGVSLMHFLRLIYNNRRPKEEQLNVFKFKNFVEERAEIVNYPKNLLQRNLNEGFSGGEKKKTEILQMLILEPRYVFLDEIDSGLDRSSVQEVFGGLAKFKDLFPKTSFFIITHYDRAQEYLSVDYIHDMSDGELVSSKKLIR